MLVASLGSATVMGFAIHGQGPKPPANCFAYKLPAEIKKPSIKGLKVNFKVTETDAKEGYFIDLFAGVGDPDRPSEFKKVRIGQSTIFKPLQKGEKATVYLAMPKDEAWRTDGHLWICWEIAPANAARTAPKVALECVNVETRTKE